MSVLIKGMEMPKSCKTCGLGCVGSMLNNPIADSRSPNCPLVEVVRCKDCKWWKRVVDEFGDDFFCAFGQNKSFREDFFCADGKRRSK